MLFEAMLIRHDPVDTSAISGITSPQAWMEAYDTAPLLPEAQLSGLMRWKFAVMVRRLQTFCSTDLPLEVRCSPLPRCQTTLERILSAVPALASIPITIDDRLMEVPFGLVDQQLDGPNSNTSAKQAKPTSNLDTKPSTNVPLMLARDRLRWIGGKSNHIEARGQSITRAKTFLEDFVPRHNRESRALLISHGLFIACLDVAASRMVSFLGPHRVGLPAAHRSPRRMTFLLPDR